MAPFAAHERAGDAEQLLAHRAGRGDEQQQLALAVRAHPAEQQLVASEIGHLERRRRLTDRDGAIGHQRAERRHPLMQHPDLARERQDHHAEPTTRTISTAWDTTSASTISRRSGRGRAGGAMLRSWVNAT